jgi:hypothetical protein
MISRILKQSRWRSLARGALGMFSAYLEMKAQGARGKGQGTANSRKARRSAVGHGKKLGIPDDFFENYAAADGWDPEKYVKIVTVAKTGNGGDGGNGGGGNGANVKGGG